MTLKEIKSVNVQHNLYIIKSYGKELNLIKLGYSGRIRDRLKLYYNNNPLTEIIGTFYRPDAEAFEKNLHSVLKSALMREWYKEDLLPTILDSIKNGISNDLKDKRIKEDNTYVEMVKQYDETGDIESYKHRKTYYKLIHDCVNYYGKTWNNYSQATKMIEEYESKYKGLLKEVRKCFKVGNLYSVKQAKDTLQDVYNSKGINRTAKATGLREFLSVSFYSKRQGAKVINCVEIKSLNKTQNK